MDVRTSRLIRELAVTKAQFQQDWFKGTHWIDIKKMHPKIGQTVLVFKQFYNNTKTHWHGNYYVATFVRKPQDKRTYAFVDQVGWWGEERERDKGSGRGVWQYTDVTHWMPLPEPPFVVPCDLRTNSGARGEASQP